jgi:hypothetical protein
MTALLKWRKAWTIEGGSTAYADYEETWTEAWAFEAGTLDATGRSTLAGDFELGEIFDIGSGTMDTVGRGSFLTMSLDYLEPDIHPVSGTLNTAGRSTVTGNLDFEEPFFVDPPLELNPVGRMVPSATLLTLINKSIGTGAMSTRGRLSFATVTLSINVAVTKPLFSVSLSTTGRFTLTADPSATTIKATGAGTMDMSGRSTISQTGFQINAPAPYTHPVGSGALSLIGAVEITGDTSWTDQPPFDFGSASLGLVGHSTVSTPRLFAGGLLSLSSLSIQMRGMTGLRSAFSHPGFDFPGTEAVAVYEGLDMQEAVIDVEGDDIVV